MKGILKMYYATFSGIGESDIAAFKTKRDRDDWVDFKDEVSIVAGTTVENCVFKRTAISRNDALCRIPFMTREQDISNPNLTWYII